MDKRLRERRGLQKDLQSAIQRNELSLDYQPQALISGEIVGFEALVRWHHPMHGLIGADGLHSACRRKRADHPDRRMDPSRSMPRGGFLAAIRSRSPSISRRFSSVTAIFPV